MLKRSWAPLAAVALVAGVLTTAAVAAIGVGQTAPNFVLTDLNGNRHSLASKKNNAKAVVIIFVNQYCPVSKPYEARIKALHEKYRERGVTFFAIDSTLGTTLDDQRRNYREAGWRLPVLRDPRVETAEAYGAQHTPEVFILDTNLRVRYHGAIDNNQDESKVEPNKNWADRAIAAVLAGRNPDPASTRAFGCAIRRP